MNSFVSTGEFWRTFAEGGIRNGSRVPTHSLIASRDSFLDLKMPSTEKQRSVLRHTFMNLAGLGLPLVAAIFTIPSLIRKLGDERFGLLTLVWAIVGYFGLFDFGLGRALTQQFSVLIARDEQDR